MRDENEKKRKRAGKAVTRRDEAQMHYNMKMKMRMKMMKMRMKMMKMRMKMMMMVLMMMTSFFFPVLTFPSPHSRPQTSSSPSE